MDNIKSSRGKPFQDNAEEGQRISAYAAREKESRRAHCIRGRGWMLSVDTVE